MEDRRQAAEAARHRDKLDGQQVYGIDIKLPGCLLCAAIKDVRSTAAR